ncbi:DUF3795 domain-containing protein [Dehalogenimonas sp. THU2]|uniref:DUF3795 domain-containing protein n=1 Tax=Dehalogenimonas sp. THU2 TaxID=3151121 RepID=UPI0032185E9D
MIESMIAPCGLNCGVCYAHLTRKKKCPGCRAGDENKSASCVDCKIKTCEKLAASGGEFCFRCDEYPCARMKHLDKRYRVRYGVSPIGNMERIAAVGIAEFTAGEAVKWRCAGCGGTVCVHTGECAGCGAGTNTTNTTNTTNSNTTSWDEGPRLLRA